MKEQDDREEHDEALREELEASKEGAAQARTDRERSCKIADLRKDLDQACWDSEECRHDMELNVACTRDSVHDEVKDRHSKDLAMR